MKKRHMAAITRNAPDREQALQEMKTSFQEDYERIHTQAEKIRQGQSIEEGTVSIEEFRQAGIDTIVQLYGKEMSDSEASGNVQSN
jgi:hypothetical protein